MFSDALKSSGRFTWTRLRAFGSRVWAEAPTLAAEIIAWLFIVSWSYSLLMYGTSSLPTAIAESFERGPYHTMSVLGVLLAAVQLFALLSANDRLRALCSFAAAVWIGGLAGSLYAGDGNVPSGLGYLGLSFLSLTGFWKVKPHALLSLISGALTLLRSGNSRTRN